MLVTDINNTAVSKFINAGVKGDKKFTFESALSPETQYCICLMCKADKTCKISKIEINYTN